MSDDEANGPGTQFIPGDNDEEELWDVIEILEEKGQRYKVKWAGNNPTTGKPWAPSWVGKTDCTNDLIAAWKEKKKKKDRRKTGTFSSRFPPTTAFIPSSYEGSAEGICTHRVQLSPKPPRLFQETSKTSSNPQ